MITITKKELANHFQHLVANKNLRESIVDALFDGARRELQQGNKLKLHEFGTFTPVSVPPRMSHNPRTGEKVATEGRTKARFTPSKQLKKL